MSLTTPSPVLESRIEAASNHIDQECREMLEEMEDEFFEVECEAERAAFLHRVGRNVMTAEEFAI